MSLRHWPDFRILVSLGLIPGFSAFFKFGQNPDIDTLTQPEDVWVGGDIYPFLSAAGTASIVSTSVQDLAGGTGASKVTIYGLDANFNLQQEEISLNGTTPVLSSGTYLRVNRMDVSGPSGSNETNAGTITATVNGSNVAIISANEGQTLQAIYTVPANHSLLLDRFFTSIEKKANASGTFHFEVRPFGGSWNIKQTVGTGTNGTGSFERSSRWFFPIPEKSDIRIRCHNIDANDVQVAAAFDGVLVDLAGIQL